MACNSWEKLEKAQRDYAKPKFAIAFVDKALKKNSTNPYLSAWKADLALQQNLSSVAITQTLAEILSKSTITDVRFLSYLYKLFVEATRRAYYNGLERNTVTSKALTPWQSAAKTLHHRDDRFALWNALFKTAMREDCWEDVRFAVVNCIKERPPGKDGKKTFHYALILATQIAAEQKEAECGTPDRMAQVQRDMALRLIKQAFTAPPDDPIAMNNIQDLRFMAEIFKRQNRAEELYHLWYNKSEDLKELFDLHRHDLMMLTVRVLRQNENWPLLERHCIDTINWAAETEDNTKVESWELCARRWEVWAALLDAVNRHRTQDEGKQIVAKQMEKYFGVEVQATDRHLRLTYLMLRQYIGEPMLPYCIDYFGHHSRLPCCFADLRPYVQDLSSDDCRVFAKFLVAQTNKYQASSRIDQADYENWRQTELHVLKFQYLLLLTPQPQIAQRAAIEDLFRNTMSLLRLWPGSLDVGCLAIYLLLNLHHRLICRDEGENPLEVTANSRILLQVSMFARHLVEHDKEKQERKFSLLAARLHLNLGLGTVAFKLYGHAKCKEILLDTLSPLILSRISQTHPFEAKGYGGFSADDELAKVISTIERMERVTNDSLFTDAVSFLWDQAIDALEVKRRLNSSLTKHLCVLERRRIARFKGEPVENLPVLPFKTYKDISDNIDRAVFPSFEIPKLSDRTHKFIMPNSIPDERWVSEMHYDQEKTCRLLYDESVAAAEQFDPFIYKHQGSFRGRKAFHTQTESHMLALWDRISFVVYKIHFGANYPVSDPENFKELLKGLRKMRKVLELQRMPMNTTLKPEDEPTLFHENMLMACYGRFEICLALLKLVKEIREKIIKAKNKDLQELKNELPKNYDTELLQETQACFQAVRDVAESYINLLKKRGVAAIKAQVRWGVTGEAMKSFLTDDDVEYYAKEYVDSALESWKGVLKVRLG